MQAVPEFFPNGRREINPGISQCLDSIVLPACVVLPAIQRDEPACGLEMLILITILILAFAFLWRLVSRRRSIVA